LLEEDALVGGMLVDEDEALGAFGDEVKLRHAADDVEAEAIGDERLGARGGALRQRFLGEGERGLEGDGLGFAF
jgi:hypothetical protein